jgi:hypothetical protein
VSGIEWSLSLEPIVPAITFKSTVKGGNILGLEAPPEELVLTLLSATFNFVSDYSIVNSAANTLLDDIISVAKAARAYNSYVDLNHAGAEQDHILSYGPVNKAFLEAAAKKYDRNGVFQIECPGGFKVCT